MCRKITCPACEKPSWSGCGAHVDQVLGDVAVADRCSCTAEERKAATPPWWRRLLGA